ncbi:unnamed protein product [Rotaria magnacalcarata]|uniref:Uncharacterized protein n=1 Tax=Rotaria magnacalcarata TaxID=392030 RepID=A0A820CDG5_9BILA|nr:unnamed protein product [Rotaria magnacalcarata]
MPKRKCARILLNYISEDVVSHADHESAVGFSIQCSIIDKSSIFHGRSLKNLTHRNSSPTIMNTTLEESIFRADHESVIGVYASLNLRKIIRQSGSQLANFHAIRARFGRSLAEFFVVFLMDVEED